MWGRVVGGGLLLGIPRQNGGKICNLRRNQYKVRATKILATSRKSQTEGRRALRSLSPVISSQATGKPPHTNNTTMFFGGDPFEHFAGMHGGGGSRRGGMGGRGGGDVDTTKLYETLGVSLSLLLVACMLLLFRNDFTFECMPPQSD